MAGRITSVHNRRVTAATRLHGRRHRRAAGLTLLEGPAQVADAARAGAALVEVFALDPGDVPAEVAAQVTLVTPPVLARLAGTASPRGPVAVVRIPAPAGLRPVDTVVLWGVADPGNAGAVVRSAAAFGFDVAVTATTTDLWSPKALRAAAATQFRTSVAALGDDPIADLAAAGLTCLAAVVTGGEDVGGVELPGPVALLIGPEAHGLPAAVAATAHRVTLSLEGGVESLNAAVAAGVLMHVLAGRRRPA